MATTTERFPEGKTLFLVGYGNDSAGNIRQFLSAGGLNDNPLAREVAGVAIFNLGESWQEQQLARNPGMPRTGWLRRNPSLLVNKEQDKVHHDFYNKTYKKESARVMLHLPDYMSRSGDSHVYETRRVMDYFTRNWPELDHYALVMRDNYMNSLTRRGLPLEELGMPVILVDRPTATNPTFGDLQLSTDVIYASMTGLVTHRQKNQPSYPEILKNLTAPTGFASLGVGEAKITDPKKYEFPEPLVEDMISEGKLAIVHSWAKETWQATTPPADGPRYTFLTCPRIKTFRYSVDQEEILDDVSFSLRKQLSQGLGIKTTLFIQSAEVPTDSSGKRLVMAGTFAPAEKPSLDERVKLV